MRIEKRAIAIATGILAISCLVAGTVVADVVYLKSGQKFEGAAEENGDQVILRLERGSLTFPRGDVERVEKSPPPWEVYEEKAKQIQPGDVAGHLELARWCRTMSLSLRMRKELELVLAVEPENETARAMLGHKKVDGKWLTPEELLAMQQSKPPAPAPAPAANPAPRPAPAPTPAPASSSGPRTIPDGSYGGASRGYVDDVGVQVAVSGGRISSVRVTSTRENRTLTSLADVPPQIVQKQRTQVDATTGATITSRAIMRAAQSALDSSVPVPLSEVPDGRYTAAARGYWFDITVEVEAKGGRISSVRIVSSREPPKNPQAQQALTDIPKLIVAQQRTSVQPIPGGEVTSLAIMRAAQSALDSAVPRVLK